MYCYKKKKKMYNNFALKLENITLVFIKRTLNIKLFICYKYKTILWYNLFQDSESEAWRRAFRRNVSTSSRTVQSGPATNRFGLSNIFRTSAHAFWSFGFPERFATDQLHAGSVSGRHRNGRYRTTQDR